MFDVTAPAELNEPAGRALVRARLSTDMARDLAAVDAGDLASVDLCELTTRIEQLRRYLDAAESHLLAELDARRTTDLRAGLVSSKWLADRAGLPAGVARQRLALARRLAALPTVDAALSNGRIGVDHARVFTDVINPRNHDAMAPVLGDLIDAADGTVFSRWKADVTALAAILDPDGTHDPAADLARNRLSMSPSNEFMLGRFELSGERALTVHDTLHAVADELFHQYSRDSEQFSELPVPNRATLLALALEEVCRRALAVDRSSSTPPRVEATLTIHTTPPGYGCGHVSPLGGGEGGDTGGDPALRAVWWIHNSLGSPIPAAMVRTFLCDPTFYAALVDSLGIAVDMGRATRTATPSQRRALTLRDGGCTFPGCDHPATWCDAHHIAHWNRDNGASDLDNFALVCRRHHRVAHRHGWTLTLDDGGWTHWTTPTGHTKQGQRHHQRVHTSQQRAGP